VLSAFAAFIFSLGFICPTWLLLKTRDGRARLIPPDTTSYQPWAIEKYSTNTTSSRKFLLILIPAILGQYGSARLPSDLWWGAGLLWYQCSLQFPNASSFMELSSPLTIGTRAVVIFPRHTVSLPFSPAQNCEIVQRTDSSWKYSTATRKTVQE
jgi:hypothetical protein